MSIVSIARANSRYATVKKALSLISADVKKSIKGKKKVMIKPNFVSDHIQLAATHVDCVRAIIDFILPTSAELLIAEGSAGDTMRAYKNFGYVKLARDYGVELIDLNDDDYEEVEIFNRGLVDVGTTKVRISKTALEVDYRISPAMLKTHDTVIATLSIKNMVMGCVQDKVRMHQGYQAINLNIYKIAKLLPVHLAVIDGWKGMEGNGPVHGTAVDMGIALASTDAVSADFVAAKVMGFDPKDIGYLSYAAGNFEFEKLGEGNFEKIEIVGLHEKVSKCFKPHYTWEEQKKWQIGKEMLKIISQKYKM